MRRLYDFRTRIFLGLTAVIVGCFFLPWIRVHVTSVAAAKELMGASDSASVFSTSGAGVPQFANGRTQKIFIKVAGLFFKSVKDADKKSYLIWSVVVLAVVVAALSVALKGKWVASAILGALCLVVAIGATVKILMTDLRNLAITVQICWPLWTILGCFLLMGVAHAIGIPIERKPSAPVPSPMPEPQP